MSAERPPNRRPVEWPTLLLAAVIHGGWMAVTFLHDVLPIWLLVPAGGWFVAWHGSLQHETIHGHPTSSRRLNALIGGLPLAMWLPYACYRRDHIAHHVAETVTHPTLDPESRYLPPAATPASRARMQAAALQAPLAGWLLLGPLLTVGAFLTGEARRLTREPGMVVRDWLQHLLGLAIVAAWLAWCGLGFGLYLAAFVYPGIALSLLRSYAEHRAAEMPGHRVAIVERGGPFALLFLNNHLHAAHHRAPGITWYALPGYYRRHRARILAENGGLRYRSYGEIVRRFAFVPHDVLVHPHLP